MQSHQIYKAVVLMNVYPLHHSVSFYPSLLTFHLQITYRKIRNLQIDVDKLVGDIAVYKQPESVVGI